MKVILGLGNPGLKFRFSRHNLGFLAVDKLAKSHKIKISQKGLNCLFGQGRIGSEKVLLAKPLTFVNLSGEAVAAIVRQKETSLADLLVICDDVSLPLGKIRIRSKGSDGGHKGLRSIIGALHSQDFARLRIGIGRFGQELSKYVLGKFHRRETRTINAALDEAVGATEVWIEKGVAAAMNKFNAAT